MKIAVTILISTYVFASWANAGNAKADRCAKNIQMDVSQAYLRRPRSQ
ncbi:MAG: hypothetical protein ACJAWT_001901 [Glaciecola sp.]|jgi:hypothetical protein